MISSCSDPVIKKKIHVHCVEVLHVAHTRVCVLLILKSPGGNNAKISCVGVRINVLENIDGKAQ